MDTPKTATEMVMKFDLETTRIEARDRAVAMSIGRDMTEQFYRPEELEEACDARKQIQRAAEMAAYTAIQKERELHAADMQALRLWSEARWAEEMLKPKVIFVPQA